MVILPKKDIHLSYIRPFVGNMIKLDICISRYNNCYSVQGNILVKL